MEKSVIFGSNAVNIVERRFVDDCSFVPSLLFRLFGYIFFPLLRIITTFDTFSLSTNESYKCSSRCSEPFNALACSLSCIDCGEKNASFQSHALDCAPSQSRFVYVYRACDAKHNALNLYINLCETNKQTKRENKY